MHAPLSVCFRRGKSHDLLKPARHLAVAGNVAHLFYHFPSALTRGHSSALASPDRGMPLAAVERPVVAAIMMPSKDSICWRSSLTCETSQLCDARHGILHPWRRLLCFPAKVTAPRSRSAARSAHGRTLPWVRPSQAPAPARPDSQSRRAVPANPFPSSPAHSATPIRNSPFPKTLGTVPDQS